MAPVAWRKSKGLTAADVARLLGCSVPSLYNYESGKRDAPNRIVQKYDEISGGAVTSDDLHLVRQRFLRRAPKRAA